MTARTWFVRIGWLALMWVAGVVAVGLAAVVMKLLMRALGLQG